MSSGLGRQIGQAAAGQLAKTCPTCGSAGLPLMLDEWFCRDLWHEAAARLYAALRGTPGAPKVVEMPSAERPAPSELDRAAARIDQLEQLVVSILAQFTEKGHPGLPCRRTGWVQETRIAAWREVLDSPGGKQ